MQDADKLPKPAIFDRLPVWFDERVASADLITPVFPAWGQPLE